MDARGRAYFQDLSVAPPPPGPEDEAACERRDGRTAANLRVLLIAEAANPEWASVPLEGWSHGRAISALTDAHLVTQIRNRPAILRAGVEEGTGFTAIDSESLARPLYRLASFLRGGSGRGWTMVTAIGSVSYPYFEFLVWRQFQERLRRGEYDIVHRLTPLSPTAPSPLAAKCASVGIPFVLGPLNGGVPWPAQFASVRRREREWLSLVRGGYRVLPGFRSTRQHAAAILVGSRDAFMDMPERYWRKCVYIPENGIDPNRFSTPIDRPADRPLRVVFVGRLVPYKGADMLLEAVAPLVRDSRLLLDIIGDGPQMPQLRAIVSRERLEQGIRLVGWIPHKELQARLVRSDVFAFPSIREFGGAVVLEAMALGLVPVVVAYGGPAELVSARTGYALPIGPREQIVRSFRDILTRLSSDMSELRAMGARARARVLAQFTWEAKARQVLEVYRWVRAQRCEKPDFGMPLPDSAADPAACTPH